MAKKKVIKRTVKKSKPIGFVKQGNSYKLVYGTKSNPKLGKTSFKSKDSLLKKAKSLI